MSELHAPDGERPSAPASEAGHRHTFPRKLYDLLENAPVDMVAWLADGNSFRVVDESAFCERVLPKHFSHSKMASFHRQLNIYGFRLLRKVRDRAARSRRRAPRG